MGLETLLIAGIAATAVGTGVSAYSQYQAGKSQEALAKYNAAVSDQAALDAARDGRAAANVQRAQNARLQARQRALYAAAGVNIDTASPLMVRAQQAGELEMAALEQELQANSQAARLRSQAVLDRMQGTAARRAGTLGAAATVLQGAGQIAQTGMQYRAYKGIS